MQSTNMPRQTGGGMGARTVGEGIMTRNSKAKPVQIDRMNRTLDIQY